MRQVLESFFAEFVEARGHVRFGMQCLGTQLINLIRLVAPRPGGVFAPVQARRLGCTAR